MLTEDQDVEFRRPAEGGGAPEVVFSIPKGFMYDSTAAEQDGPVYSPGVRFALDPDDGQRKYVLRVSADRDWLTDPARVYPVRIDPSFNAGYPTKDCFVDTNNTSLSHCGNNTSYVYAGVAGDYATYRGLLDFDVSSIPEGADVETASVDVRTDPSKTVGYGSPVYGLFRAGRKWSNGATWNDSNATGAWTGGDPQDGGIGVEGNDPIDGSTEREYHFNGIDINYGEPGYEQAASGMADLVQAWISGTITNTGLVLKEFDE